MRGPTLFAAAGLALALHGPAAASPGEMVVEDFADTVTPLDRAWNDFSGNRTEVNSSAVSLGLRRSADRSALNLRWDFRDAPGDAAGFRYSLFGLFETELTFDGTSTVFIAFPEHALNFDDLDAPLAEPGGPRQATALTFDVYRRGTNPLALRVELVDRHGAIRAASLPVRSSINVQRLRWDFRGGPAAAPGAAFDLGAVKQLGILVEKAPAGYPPNAEQGSVDISRIALETSRPETKPASDDVWMDLAERRACQYFFDWASRKPSSAGLPQDRSTFADLLAPAAVAYALPACLIAAERQWLSRSNAVDHALHVIRALDDAAAFGAEPVGRIGYRGWYYRYLGPDARRKLNFDYKDTPIDESLNTVEIDPADTALLLMGVLAAQSYFQEDHPAEREIRQRAQVIFDRVEWPFMLDMASMQFRHAWKPAEKREGPAYEIPDADGKGFYAGAPGRPELYDAYSDATALLALMAAGSTVHQTPAQAWCAWTREIGEDGFMRSASGALASYQTLHAFINTRMHRAPVCVDQPPVDWYENSRQAMLRAIAEARRNRFSSYAPDAWGVSGAEGPFEVYHAYGFPALALTNRAPALEDGTVTYSAMISAASFGADLHKQALLALRGAWKREHWHARFGPASAFNDNIAEAGIDTEGQKFDSIFRRHGPWVQRALFATQQGQILLHLENARSGLVWQLLARNVNVQRAFDRLAAPPEIVLDAERGEGEGTVMKRSQARGGETVQLKPKASRAFSFEIHSAASYAIVVRYSNDSYGPPDHVEAFLDGASLGAFQAFDTSRYVGTGSFGSGWNVFASSVEMGPVDLEPGRHTVTLTVRSGDEPGVEIDVIQLKRVAE